MERLSPSFVRVELGGPALAEFGVDGPLYDQRIKLVFPNDAGRAPVVRGRRRVVVGHLAPDPRGRARPHAHLHRASRSRVRARTLAWSSTSSCTCRTARPARARPGPRGRAVSDRLVIDGPAPRAWSTAASSSTRAPRASCCWWPTRRRCPRCAASSRTSAATPAERALLEVPESADVRLPTSRAGARRRRLAAPGRGAARVAPRRRGAAPARASVLARSSWSTPRWTRTCGRRRRTRRLARTWTSPWPTWATTSTGSTPGSPGSRK